MRNVLIALFPLLYASIRPRVEGKNGERTNFGYVPIEKVLVNLPESKQMHTDLIACSLPF